MRVYVSDNGIPVDAMPLGDDDAIGASTAPSTPGIPFTAGASVQSDVIQGKGTNRGREGGVLLKVFAKGAPCWICASDNPTAAIGHTDYVPSGGIFMIEVPSGMRVGVIADSGSGTLFLIRPRG